MTVTERPGNLFLIGWFIILTIAAVFLAFADLSIHLYSRAARREKTRANSTR